MRSKLLWRLTQMERGSGRVSPLAPIFGFIADGDSITSGVAGDTFAWPMVMRWRTSLPMSNVAVSGHLLSQRLAAFATDVAPLYNAGTKNAVIIAAGINDINASATPAATIEGLLQDYCAAVHALGASAVAVVCTLIPTTVGVNGWSAGDETIRLAYNALVRANWHNYADYLIDFELDPEFDSQADAANTTYYLDDLHPTNAGHYIRGFRAITELGLTKVPASDQVPILNLSTAAGTLSYDDAWTAQVTTERADSPINFSTLLATQPIPSGLVYFEARLVTFDGTAGTFGVVGVSTADFANSLGFDGAKSIAQYTSNGWFENSSNTANGLTFTQGDTIGVCVRNNGNGTGSMWFTKDGSTFYGTASTNAAGVVADTNGLSLSDQLGAGAVYAAVGSANSGNTIGGRKWSVNFGQSAFAYTRPSGYASLASFY